VAAHIPAVLETWYAGQAQGTAIADVLFGDYNPGGKLPVTFHKTVEELPPLGDYDITKGRTYWFNKNEVLYPFGHGLSYTSFEYGNLKVNKETFHPDKNIQVTVRVDVHNTGKVQGDEVVQLYVKDLKSSVVQPLKRLRKFKRISLDSGETQTVQFKLGTDDFAYWDETEKDWHIEDGDFELQIGSSSEDIRVTQTVIAER
jgi:beta-glucosidase